MIHIRALHKSFGSRRVLDGVSGEVRQGEIVTIVGPSGCGKSTLLRCLNGLETFEDGCLSVAGFELTPGAARPGDLRRLRSAVGMVFQDFQLFPHLTVVENVTLAPRIVRGTPADSAKKTALELLDRVGLADRAEARPAQLSGGQKQRVAIARVLAQGVRVLLLDEPTSALDPEMREEVREVLRQVAHDGGGDGKALTIVLVTHEMRLAIELSHTLWVMQSGRIVESGVPKEIAARPESAVAREFLRLAGESSS
ncbi:MAG TPA: amino acid ABC transporter ATP-binding protein [Polyangiaceae bacterium]|nr:amino acid ABC transporter ATP-binding protein [Polyangiaceae bacterium]